MDAQCRASKNKCHVSVDIDAESRRLSFESLMPCAGCSDRRSAADVLRSEPSTLVAHMLQCLRYDAGRRYMLAADTQVGECATDRRSDNHFRVRIAFEAVRCATSMVPVSWMLIAPTGKTLHFSNRNAPRESS